MSAPVHHQAAPVAVAHHDHHEHHEHHGPTVKMYIAIFLALCVLTVVTVVTAKMDFAQILHDQRMGDLVSNVVALGIACTKAALVILFFMHVKYENKLVGLAVVASVIWLAFLLLITASDYMTRIDDWHLFTK